LESTRSSHLQEARELHSSAKKLLHSGINPIAERRAKVNAAREELKASQREAESSFERIAEKWWSIGKSPRHADTVMRRLKADVFPAYGHKPVDTITAADIRELMLVVERRDARDVAKRVHETTGQIFRYAIAHGLASGNPAAGFKPRDILAEARTENFARVETKDLPQLLAKMDEYKGDALTRFAMKLMAYTFVRTSELIEAPWQEFDLENATWTIPPQRMKMATSHIVPLS
jgi:integrase